MLISLKKEQTVFMMPINYQAGYKVLYNNA